MTYAILKEPQAISGGLFFDVIGQTDINCRGNPVHYGNRTGDQPTTVEIGIIYKQDGKYSLLVSEEKFRNMSDEERRTFYATLPRGSVRGTISNINMEDYAAHLGRYTVHPKRICFVGKHPKTGNISLFVGPNTGENLQVLKKAGYVETENGGHLVMPFMNPPEDQNSDFAKALAVAMDPESDGAAIENTKKFGFVQTCVMPVEVKLPEKPLTPFQQALQKAMVERANIQKTP